MISGHGPNPNFFFYKKKIGRSEHSDSISFLLYFSLPIPLKVDIICVSPLITRA